MILFLTNKLIKNNKKQKYYIMLCFYVCNGISLFLIKNTSI